MEIETRIIMEMKDELPLTIQQIAEKIRDGKKIHKKRCEQRIKYNMESLEAANVIEQITDGRRKLYKLRDGVEILNGKISLYDENGETKYEEEVVHVLRMEDEDGNVLLNMLQ